MAALIVVFVVVAVILIVLNQSTNPPAARSTSTSAVSTAAADRIRTAASAANAATATTRTKLDALHGIPTPATVQMVINPYVTALQLYRAVQAKTTAPAAARTAAVSAYALVTRDVRFFRTINGLPPLKLGTYLTQFGRDATQLQKSLGKLQRELRAAQS